MKGVYHVVFADNPDSLTIIALNRGPKPAIVTSATLVLVGNWVRYAGARATGGHFGVVVFGQILIGLAQPFVLSAPTRYSDLWFTDRGKISATAVASLANPFGGALGQLISPFWATKASEVPNMVLYTAILVGDLSSLDPNFKQLQLTSNSLRSQRCHRFLFLPNRQLLLRLRLLWLRSPCEAASVFSSKNHAST